MLSGYFCRSVCCAGHAVIESCSSPGGLQHWAYGLLTNAIQSD